MRVFKNDLVSCTYDSDEGWFSRVYRPSSLIIRLFAITFLFFHPWFVCGQRTEEFDIKSQFVGDIYRVEVVLPNEYDSTKTYPVMLCLDWLVYSGFISNTIGIMDFSSQIDPIIVVGIVACGGIDAFYSKRNRDFLPPVINDVKPNEMQEGAGNFLRFLENELLPAVDSRYSVDANRRGLSGYSYGGLFCLYVLIKHPTLFSRYLIGSPSGWYDNFSLISELENDNKRPSNGVRRIYLAVGEKEVDQQMMSYRRLHAYFLQNSDSYQFQGHIIEGETHSTAVISTYLKGIRFLFND